MAVRMLTNLKAVYLRDGDFLRGAAHYRTAAGSWVPDDPLQHRDLGAALFQAGRHGNRHRAIVGIFALGPQADDRAAVSQLLAQAKASGAVALIRRTE